jgi:hypothetical protein
MEKTERKTIQNHLLTCRLSCSEGTKHHKTTTGLEKYTFGIKLDPVIKILLTDESMFRDILTTILSVRFRYKQQFSQTTGTIIDDSYYITHDTHWDYDQGIVYDPILLTKDSKFSFTTKYYYNEISLHLTTVEYRYSSDIDVRIGFLSTNYTRPTNTSYVTIDKKPIIYESDYSSKAIFLSAENIDYGFPGFSMEFSGGIGIKDKFTGTFDWRKNFGDKNVDIDNYWVELNLWYNYYLNKNSFLKIGASGSSYACDITIDPEGRKDEIHDESVFWKVWIEYSLHFSK